DLLHVVRAPLERDLLALNRRIDLLQRVGADEIVVELHERAVAQLPRVEIVVFDRLADERTADRAGGFIAVGTEPFAVVLELVAGVERRQRAGDPAGVPRGRRVRERTGGAQAEPRRRLEGP